MCFLNSSFDTRPELNGAIDKAEGRWRPVIVTAIFTGMRASEMRGLPWRDVDLEAGIIHVRQRADAWNNIGPPKSKAGKRDIPLAPIVVNALKQWKEECPKGELDLVFPNGAGNVESLTNVWKRFWIPLQIDCGMTIDTDRKDAEGNPALEARHASIPCATLQPACSSNTLSGHPSAYRPSWAIRQSG